MRHIKTIILGAGPAGLGTAWRLKEKNATDFLVLEQNSYPGGLSASFNTPEGYTFDLGGHVFFSKVPYFLSVAKSLLQDDMLYHDRNASVYLDGKTVPYPFQDNIAFLEPEQQLQVAGDFLKARDRQQGIGSKQSQNTDHRFYYWIKQVFGKTISDLFMMPYNRKVWACDLEKMGSYWIKDRVSTLSLEDILQRIILKEKKGDWGPNATFFFPRQGTGQLFEKIAEPLEKWIRYNSRVIALDVNNKTLRLKTGETFTYDKLVSSLPLTELIRIIHPFSTPALKRKIRTAANALRYNSGYVVGLGLDFDIESDRHWVYFPEGKFPWFRMTVISNYSPAMVPEGRSSLMFDISYNPFRPMRYCVDDVIDVLDDIRFLPRIERRNIVSVFEKKTKYFYPIPTIDRDKHLGVLSGFLEDSGIFSIGRFGRWRYEEGNMDHAFLQGKDIAEQLLVTR